MKKILLITAGILLTVLGAIGLVLPVLPTTPFVLGASACFSASSPRLLRWIAKSPLLGEFIQNYRNKSGVRLSVKIRACIFLWVMLGISFVLVHIWYVRLILGVVGVAVSTHIFLLKTRKKEVSAPEQDVELNKKSKQELDGEIL